MAPGERITWMYTPRGGHGYVIPVDGIVVRTTAKRFVIEVAKRNGTLVQRSVRPESIRPR